MDFYIVTFERIGRNYAVPPLRTTADDADELGFQIGAYVRPRLHSQAINIEVDLAARRGVIKVGIYQAGTFTLMTAAQTAEEFEAEFGAEAGDEPPADFTTDPDEHLRMALAGTDGILVRLVNALPTLRRDVGYLIGVTNTVVTGELSDAEADDLLTHVSTAATALRAAQNITGRHLADVTARITKENHDGDA